jgi:hypothetical protein
MSAGKTKIASGMVGVAVSIGSGTGVSVGTGDGVTTGVSPAPHALRISPIATKKIINLKRTGTLQRKEWTNYTQCGHKLRFFKVGKVQSVIAGVIHTWIDYPLK